MLPSVRDFLRAQMGLSQPADEPMADGGMSSGDWDAASRPSTPQDWSQPVQQLPDYTMADGRTAPPTPTGQWEPWETQPAPQPTVSAGQWLADDSVSTAPALPSNRITYGRPLETWLQHGPADPTPPMPSAGELIIRNQPGASELADLSPEAQQRALRTAVPQPGSGPVPAVRPQPVYRQEPAEEAAAQITGQPEYAQPQTMTLPGVSGRELMTAATQSARTGQPISPVALYEAFSEIPFDAFQEAYQRTVNSVDRRMEGTDPLMHFRPVAEQYGVSLPSAEELNPEGRPFGSIVATMLSFGLIPDPADPYVGMAFRGAGRAIGATRRRFGQELATLGEGARAAGRAVTAPRTLPEGEMALGSGVVPGTPPAAGSGLIPMRSDLSNAAQGGVLGAASEGMTDEELTPEQRLARITSGAALATMAGRRMRPGQAGSRLGSGVVPEGPAPRPVRTVEALQEQIDYTRRVLDDIDPNTERELRDQAVDRLARLTSEMVDAQNARLRLEPAITSDVGQRAERLPITEARAERTLTQDAMTGSSGRPARPDELSGPVSIPTNMTGRMNSAVPFDPASAAAGAAAGAMTEGEDGEFDPLRAAAGMAVGAVLGTPKGRRLALKAAKKAQQATETPPNILEIVQSYRHSVGMLGNFSTGLVNAAGGPVEMAFGLPTEMIRMGVLRGMPAPVVYEVAELARGMVEGARAALGTAIGFIPVSVRNAPDFRPPLAERMQSKAGKTLGYAIDTPGRLATQTPDAMWSTAFRRWGRAREAANMVSETQSRLRPDEQIQEMNRLLNNPTAEEAERLDTAAQAFADELTYKGEPGYWEKAIGGIFRPGGRTTTSKDPMAQQVHDLVGSFLMPFYSSIFKIHKLAATRTPVLGMGANSKLGLDEKAARQVVGLGAGLWMADRAAQGLITGPGPSDPDETALLRAKGWSENSTFIPGVGYIPNDYFGAAGPMLNAVGAYYDAQRYATDKDKADDWKYGEHMARGMMRSMQRFPVVEALKDVVTMAESPTRGVTDLLAGAAGSFSPAPYRTAIGASDPYSRTTDREVDPPEMLRQKTIQRTGAIPGVGSRQDLPIAQDRFGRNVENPRQGVAAFLPRVGQQKDDPLAQVFLDARVQPGPAPSEIDGIRLTDQEKREWLRVRGEMLARRQTTLDNISRLPMERRQERLRDQLESASGAARSAVLRQIPPAERRRRQQEQKAG